MYCKHQMCSDVCHNILKPKQWSMGIVWALMKLGGEGELKYIIHVLAVIADLFCWLDNYWQRRGRGVLWQRPPIWSLSLVRCSEQIQQYGFTHSHDFLPVFSSGKFSDLLRFNPQRIFLYWSRGTDTLRVNLFIHRILCHPCLHLYKNGTS